MKTIIGIIIGLTIMAGVGLAQEPDQFKWLENGDRLKKDVIDNRTTLIVDKNGNTKGYIKRDVLDKRKMAVYDRNGNIRGFLKKDVLSDDIVYEKLGQQD